MSQAQKKREKKQASLSLRELCSRSGSFRWEAWGSSCVSLLWEESDRKYQTALRVEGDMLGRLQWGSNRQNSGPLRILSKVTEREEPALRTTLLLWLYGIIWPCPTDTWTGKLKPVKFLTCNCPSISVFHDQGFFFNRWWLTFLLCPRAAGTLTGTEEVKLLCKELHCSQEDCWTDTQIRLIALSAQASGELSLGPGLAIRSEAERQLQADENHQKLVCSPCVLQGVRQEPALVFKRTLSL